MNYLTLPRLAALALTFALSIGCDPPPPEVDGGSLDAGSDAGAATVCERDADCDDGLFCNGAESCVPGASSANAVGCVAGTAPCDAEDCTEETDLCSDDCPDADGDGVDACSGDCDDSDGSIFPGSPEVCSFDVPRDEDCDPRTFGFLDIDGDGAADARCFNEDASGTRFGGTDCNDNDASIGPTATERCDGSIDEDCDDLVDEGCLCSPEGSTRPCGPNPIGACRQGVETCTAAGWAACAGAVLPAATDACDGTNDDDCDGSVDEGCACSDGDSRACGLGACAGSQSCTGGAWAPCDGAAPTVEMCDGVDSDCDGSADADDPDVEGVGDTCGATEGICVAGRQVCAAGSLSCGGPHVGPQSEVCDHVDQDCDGELDNGVGAAACSTTFSDRMLSCRSGGGDAMVCPDGISEGPSDQPPVVASVGWRGDLGNGARFDADIAVKSFQAVSSGGIILLLAPSASLGADTNTFGGLADGGPGLALHIGARLDQVTLLTNSGGGWVVHLTEDAARLRTALTLRLSIYFDAIDILGEVQDDSGDPPLRWRFGGGSSLRDTLYGLSSSYPTYAPSIIVDNDGGLTVSEASVTVVRSATTSRPSCIGCTIP